MKKKQKEYYMCDINKHINRAVKEGGGGHLDSCPQYSLNHSSGPAPAQCNTSVKYKSNPIINPILIQENINNR